MSPSKALVARMGLHSDSLGAGVKGMSHQGELDKAPFYMI